MQDEPRPELHIFFSGLTLCLATRFLRYGHRLGTDLPSLSPAWVVLVLVLYVAAFAGVVLAFVAHWNQLQSWIAPWTGRFTRLPMGWIRPAAALGICVVIGRQIMLHAYGPSVGTDAVMFSRRAVELVLAGVNPYSVDMGDVFQRYGAPQDLATFRIDGSAVTVLSYPALSFLAFVPQSLLGWQSLELTTLLALGASLLVLVWRSPPAIAWLPLLMISADWDLVAFSAGGIFDALWLLPLLGAMVVYERGRIVVAGVLFGIACCVKQTPWLAAPFLLCFAVFGAPTVREGLGNAGRFALAAIAAFFVVNAPFIATDPAGWLRGTLTPVGGGVPLVELGVGPVLLNIIGLTAFPKSFYSVLALTVMTIGLVVYIAVYRRLKWLAWSAPMFVLWLNYRSLQNYFVFFIPTAYLGLLLQTGFATSVGVVSRRFVALVMLAAVAAVIAYGVAVRHRTDLDADVVINHVSDPDDLGGAADLTVMLTNNAATSLHPSFSIVHTKHTVPMHWHVVAGPEELAPMSAAAYTLRPPSGVNGLVQFSEGLHLRVYEKGTERRVSLRLADLKSFDADPERHSIRNPRFVDWSARSTAMLPAAWSDASERFRGAIDTSLTATTDGARLAIHGTGDETVRRGLTRVALRQSLDHPIDGVRISVTVDKQTTPLTDGLPVAGSGFELRAKGHSIYVFFADVPDVRVTTNPDDDDRIIYLPSHAGVREVHDVPLRRLVGETSYAPFLVPNKVSLVIFAGLRARTPEYAAEIVVHEVRAIH